MNQIIIEEIRSLIDYLNAKTAEYDSGNPTISDKEWDAKYFKLKLLEKEYSIYFNDSPTQTINY
jgi:NAD-dependent DNA ligase